MKKGELYITSRIKDLIIVRGKNHYPQDIEQTVERSHPALRPGCGAAFSCDIEGEEQLVIFQEVKRGFYDSDDADEVLLSVRQAVSRVHQVDVWAVFLLDTGSIPKTSSGKIQRHACRELFMKNGFEPSAKWEKVNRSCHGIPMCGERPDEWPQDLVFQWLRELVSRKCHIPLSDFNGNNRISSFAINSMVLVEMQQDIADVFDVEFPLERLAGDATLADISREVHRLVEKQRLVPDEAMLLESLDTLPEEELDRLLAVMN